MPITDRSKLPVVVLGSKPDAAYPDVRVQAVITAKSSVLLAQQYREKYNAKIIALVPWPELRDRDYMFDALRTAQPDELVVLGDDKRESESYITEVLQLQNTKITIKSHFYRNWSMISYLGWHRYVLAFHMLCIRGVRFFMKGFFADLFRGRQLQWLSRSTGINCMMYALEQYPEAQTVLVAGIGLEAGGHFDGKGGFTAKSAKSDQLFMRHWKTKNKQRFQTTDEKLNQNGGIAKWSGPIVR